MYSIKDLRLDGDAEEISLYRSCLTHSFQSAVGDRRLTLAKMTPRRTTLSALRQIARPISINNTIQTNTLPNTYDILPPYLEQSTWPVSVLKCTTPGPVTDNDTS